LLRRHIPVPHLQLNFTTGFAAYEREVSGTLTVWIPLLSTVSKRRIEVFAAISIDIMTVWLFPDFRLVKERTNEVLGWAFAIQQLTNLPLNSSKRFQLSPPSSE
jgi:hypothetical protein